MKPIQNLHTHTTYCDGSDTPEEIIKEAVAQGFSSLGFSGHSYMFYAPEHSMSIEGTEQYKTEIRALKEKYKGVIDIYLGLEFDMYSQIDTSGYDYLIGAVHYLKIDGRYVGFDRDLNTVLNIINTYFNGDGMLFAKMYYETISHLPEYGNFDIVAHFDIITKHIENSPMFDTDSAEYKRYVSDALDALCGKIPFFELNTGAIARGYRTTPYPSQDILKELYKRKCRIVIGSDCHDKRQLSCAFSDAIELVKYIGFGEIYIKDKNGFTGVKI